MKFNQSILQRVLMDLNIEYNSNKIRKNWMSIRCPLHSDKNLGNASINLDSGVISCFACGQNMSIIKMYMREKSCSYSEAKKRIFDGFDSFAHSKDVTYKKEQSFKKVYVDDYTTIEFNPKDYYYTKIRGYTKRFCKQFNIRRCLGSEYDDYFLIPIIDKKKNINTVEARKLMQRETIIKYFKTKEFVIEPEIYFKEYRKKFGIKLNKNYEVVDKDNNIIFDPHIHYLMKPKTLYPKDSDIDFTIWNIDNLDRNSDLYVSEGLATIPKVYLHISKNCTSIFGAKVTEDQLDYLKQFKSRIIIIPDNDEASYELIKLLNETMDNIFVIDIKISDTDEKFVRFMKNCQILSAGEWVLKNFSKYNKKIDK